MIDLFFEYLECSCDHGLTCNYGGSYGKHHARIQHPRWNGKVEWIGISFRLLADVRSLTNILCHN